MDNEANKRERTAKHELVSKLKRQIEFYFSKENLSSDVFLVSQMNSERYVPIETIASFKKIRHLTTDLNLITNVMRSIQSLHVSDNGKMVRSSSTFERKTVIIRELPKYTTKEEILEIFALEKNKPDELSSKIEKVRLDIGNNWFVTFSTEKDCLKAIEFLRKQTFKGEPIRCRVKSENLLRSYYNLPSGGPNMQQKTMLNGVPAIQSSSVPIRIPESSKQTIPADISPQINDSFFDSFDVSDQQKEQYNSQRNLLFSPTSNSMQDFYYQQPQSFGMSPTYYNLPPMNMPYRKLPIPRRSFPGPTYYQRQPNYIDTPTYVDPAQQYCQPLRSTPPVIHPEHIDTEQVKSEPFLVENTENRFDRYSLLPKEPELVAYNKTKIQEIIDSFCQREDIEFPETMKQFKELCVVRDKPNSKAFQFGTPLPIMFPNKSSNKRSDRQKNEDRNESKCCGNDDGPSYERQTNLIRSVRTDSLTSAVSDESLSDQKEVCKKVEAVLAETEKQIIGQSTRDDDEQQKESSSKDTSQSRSVHLKLERSSGRSSISSYSSTGSSLESSELSSSSDTSENSDEN